MKVLQHDEFLKTKKINNKLLLNRKFLFVPSSLQSLQTDAKTETEKSARTDKIRKSGNCK